MGATDLAETNVLGLATATVKRKESKMNSKSARHMVRTTVVGAISMVAVTLNAAVVNITEGSTTGCTMTDGNTYVIQNSVSFSNASVGGSGMIVEDGATVVLYVPQGVTLTVNGADGEGMMGGGAGICVPSNATLVITGEGKIVTTGGKAGNGENGFNLSAMVVFGGKVARVAKVEMEVEVQVQQSGEMAEEEVHQALDRNTCFIRERQL